MITVFTKLKLWLSIAGAVIVAVAMAWFRGRSDGARTERAERAERDIRAARDRLAMNREGDAAERDAKSLSDEEARKEALRWSNRS